MTNEINFTKIKASHAQEICEEIDLSEQAVTLLQNNPTAAHYLQELITLEYYVDAVYFLAHALPKREATWWACLCARQAWTEKTPENEIKAVELAEAWVYKPTEDNRILILPITEELTYKTATSWAVMAAFWSGDDISPVPQAIIPPPEKLYAKAVIGAVLLSATQEKASKVNENYRLFLQQGINIANGGNGRTVQ